MALISIENIMKRYGNQTILNGVSLEVESGARVVILGPSGCGKTTLLRLLAGFIAPDSGKIQIDGQTVAADGRILLPPEKRNVGMVFQDLALWPHLTVKGNLEFGLKAKRVPREERENRIQEILGLMQMERFIHAKPATLSGGQRQRVALARALVLRPKVLLMDEPLSSLDPQLNLRLRREILNLHERLGFTLLYVTHNHGEAVDIGSRIVLMDKGNVIRIASPEEIREETDSFKTILVS